MSEAQTKLYVYDEKTWQTAVAKNRLVSEEPATAPSYDRGVILPLRVIEGSVALYGDGLCEGGACDENGNFVAGLHRSAIREESNRSCIRAYPVTEDEITYCDEEVIFGGVFIDHWGHALLDSTSRLWYPATHDRNTKVAFVLFPGCTFKYEQLFECAGITSDRIIIVDKPTRFSKVTVPDQTGYCFSGYRPEWIEYFNAARDGVEPSPHKKIYLTRTALGWDPMIGEQYFEDYFRNKGFHVISPEKHSIAEQISFMAGAEEIVSTMGTISAMVLFAHDNVKLTILNRSQSVVNGQLIANALRKVDCTLVDINRNFLPEQQAGNCTTVVAPNPCWNKYIKDTFGEGPDETFEKEVWPNLLQRYICEWGESMTNPKKYNWVKDRKLTDIIKRVNLVFNGKKVSTADHPKTGLQRKVDSLSEEVPLLKRELRSSTLQGTYPSEIFDENGVLKARGSIDIPFCDATSISACAFIESDKESIPAHATSTAGDTCSQLIWEAEFAISDIQSMAMNGEPRLVLQLGNAVEKRSLYILLPKDHAFASFGLLCPIEDGNDILLPFVDEEDCLFFGMKNRGSLSKGNFLCTLRNVQRKDASFLITGVMRSPIALSAKSLPQIVLQSNKSKAILLSQPVTVDRENSSAGVASWSFELTDEMVMNLYEAEGSKRLRIDSFVTMDNDFASPKLRLGYSEDDIEANNISNDAPLLINGLFVSPITTNLGNNAFEITAPESTMRNMSFESVTWSDGSLSMEGTLATALTNDESLTLTVCDGDKELAPIDFKRGIDDVKLLKIRWSFTLSAECLNGFENGKHPLFVKAATNNGTATLPVKSKKANTHWPELLEKKTLADGRIVRPARAAKSSLVLTIENGDSADKPQEKKGLMGRIKKKLG